MGKLSETHIKIIRDGVNGVCVRGVWMWLKDGKPVTRQVNTLLRLGLVDASYYAGNSASVWATDQGRQQIAT